MKSPVFTIGMDATLLAAKELFDQKRCHHLVVLEHHQVFGVLSDRDILRAVSPFAGNRMMERSQDMTTLKKRVHQVMSRELLTAAPDDTVAEAAAIMLQERVSCLPVVDAKRAPLGIVTIRDLVAWTLRTFSDHGESPCNSEHDDGIVIIINGSRCYRPHVAVAQQIRAAERTFERVNGFAAATPQGLPGPKGVPVG